MTTALLVQYAQQRADQWAARGLNLVWFQHALSVPEELLVPLVQSVETSNFVWQALNRSQSVVWQMMAERTHQRRSRPGARAQSAAHPHRQPARSDLLQRYRRARDSEQHGRCARDGRGLAG